VVNLRLWLGVLFVFGGLFGTLVHAQLTDEEKRKRDAFLKAQHEEDASPSPTKSTTPSKKKSSKPKKKPSASPSPSETPEAKKKAKESGDEETATPTPKKGAHKKSSITASASPKKKSKTAKKTEKKSDELAGKTVKPHPSPVPTPIATPQPTVARAIPVARSGTSGAPQVNVEKSGFEKEQGFEPPPPPPPHRFLFWTWGGKSTSTSANFRYLSRSVIEEIRRAPVQRRRWQFIVVHNSGTRQGNARVFDYYHRHVRRMQNGLAYHFVIGNGTSTGNGEVEVGDRWRRQINGGHVHSDYLNNIALGICLVGDFNRDQPTRAQLESCEELIRYLRERCGKTDRGDIPVRPHREMNPPRWATDCPGDAFPYSWFRKF
jgi:hypothetical protein